MFKDFEKLTEIGTVIFGSSNTTNKNVEFFCFWQTKNSFYSTKGVLEDLELSEYGYIADALESCECIPFGRGNTPLKAYENMLSIYNKVFDGAIWLVMDYNYFEFIHATQEIKGWVDFINKSEENICLFKELNNYEKSYKKYADIVIQKYNEFKSIEKVQNYFKVEEELDVESSTIEKYLEYNLKNHEK